MRSGLAVDDDRDVRECAKPVGERGRPRVDGVRLGVGGRPSSEGGAHEAQRGHLFVRRERDARIGIRRTVVRRDVRRDDCSPPAARGHEQTLGVGDVPCGEARVPGRGIRAPEQDRVGPVADFTQGRGRAPAPLGGQYARCGGRRGDAVERRTE